MDILPFSMAPALMTPAFRMFVVAGATPAERSLASLRQVLFDGPRESTFLAIEEYVGALLAAQLVFPRNTASVWPPPGTTLLWRVGTSDRPVPSTSVETEITFALSFLCSTRALRAEHEALDGKYAEAIASFCDTSQVLLLLGAFVERSITAQWPDAFSNAAIEARGRAALMKVYAQQVHFASLARTGDRDWTGAGRALVAQYQALAAGEFAKVAFIARAAEGLAHYWRAFCAHKELRLQKGTLNIESSATASTEDVDLLYANERLCDIVVYEGAKAADLLAKVPEVKSQCEKWVTRCRAKAATLREMRYKQMLIFSISDATMEARMAAVSAQTRALEVGQGFTMPPNMPVSVNPVWTRLLAIADSWTTRLGGALAIRAPVLAEHPRVPYSPDLLTAGQRSFDKTEQVLVAASRLEERIAWMQGSKDTLVHAQEVTRARETCDRLWTLYERLKRLKQTLPN